MQVVVVGAGLTGLTAAGALVASGHEVVVLDKGRTPGGRLATRRIAGAVLDHGAQFFTVRTEAFSSMLAPLIDDGLVFEWCRGFAADGPDGHPRFVVRGGMNALAKHLAAGLDVRCSRLVFEVRPASSGPAWEVVIDDGSIVPADAVIVTCPVPQTSSILMPSGLVPPEGARWLGYDETLALLVVLDRASAVPPPGGVQGGDETFSFIGDNQAKGISPVPAVTFHVRGAVSHDRWDDDPDAVHADLLVAARPWLGDAEVVESQLKRWRFATPVKPWSEPCVVMNGPRGGPIVMAGDAFAGPKVEGAYLSGLAAAAAVAGSGAGAGAGAG